MIFAKGKQWFQDWFSQQWIIIWGKKINPPQYSWLMGPFANIGPIADDWINQLAKDEGLKIERDSKSRGLIQSIKDLNLTDHELTKLSDNVIDFYQNTSNYKLGFSVNWNPFFRVFGILVNILFSRRIHQLNVPTKKLKGSEEVNSEIITLINPRTNQVKYTVWFRTLKSNNQVIFSGVYSICTLPDGRNCIKAVFPLPNGNATVIMSPSVGKKGELILDSKGSKFGDPGFYFVMIDSKGNYWSRNHRSFTDKLIVSSNSKSLHAEHTQSLWNKRVLQFKYDIRDKVKTTYNTVYSK